MKFDIIFCGRKKFTKYANQKYGWLMGSRSDHIKSNGHTWNDNVDFIDAPFKDWEKKKGTFLEAVERFKPKYVVVPDIYHWEDFVERLKMGYTFLDMGIGNIIIVPKQKGMHSKIPPEFIIGWPMANKSYSDICFDEWELFNIRGRTIHLLGSMPRRQAEMMQYHNVCSIDGNGFVKVAQKYRKAYGPNLEAINMMGEIHSDEIVFRSIDGIGKFWKNFNETLP